MKIVSRIFLRVKRKGILESFLVLIKIFLTKIYSFIRILFLNLRGYKISYSVILKGSNTFFQTNKSSINILRNSVIGRYTRITTGYSGQILIGAEVLIDDFTYIMSQERIEIGNNTKIASFCFITDFNHKFDSKIKNLKDQGFSSNPIIIGDNVWIGTHVVILPGVKIGDRAVIGAGSVVTKNIPSGSIAVGNPAKVIKKI